MKVRTTMWSVILGLAVLFCSSNGDASDAELRFGDLVDAKITDQLPLLDSDLITTWVKQIGERVARVSGRPHVQYTFKVLNDPEINAFSGPGGYIYITSGFLLDHLQNDDELAAVLAHEIAHVSERHQVSAVYRARMATASAIVLQSVVAGVAAAAGTVVSQGMITGSVISPAQALANQLQANIASDLVSRTVAKVGGEAATMLVLAVHQGFSRGDEDVADRDAVHYLHKAEFNMEALISVLEKLEAVDKTEGKRHVVPHFLASHPDLRSRINKVAGLIGEVKKQGGAK